MDDDVDTIYRQPTYDDLLRVMKYIARYKSWDFQTVNEPWRWCNEFTSVAADCLEGKKVLT